MRLRVRPPARIVIASASPFGAVAACALTLAGFAATVVLMFPGYLTNDATYVYSYIAQWRLGDWQSPGMTIVWWLIDPISPGPGSMFLLDITLYWLGFGVIALVAARRSTVLALLVPV